MSKTNHFMTGTMTCAQETMRIINNSVSVSKLYSMKVNGEIDLSDALYALSCCVPDPLTRSLFRLWYSEATKEQIAMVRMTVNYASSTMMRSEGRGITLFNEVWIKSMKNHCDYFYGHVEEGDASTAWYRDTYLNTVGDKNSVGTDICHLASTIRYALRYGYKVKLGEWFMDIPRHLRNMMIGRDMVRN